MPAELTVEKNAQPMGRDLAIQARHEMTQVTSAVALDLKALAQLTYYRFHQTSRTGCAAHEAARTAFFHRCAGYQNFWPVWFLTGRHVLLVVTSSWDHAHQ